MDTDDAVRTSEEELGFAAAQFGDEAAAPFAAAVTRAKAELTASFRLRQQLDDAIPEDEPTRHRMLTEIISRCTAADERLDAVAADFDRLRSLEQHAPQALAEVETTFRDLAGRTATAGSTLDTMRTRYAPSAAAPSWTTSSRPRSDCSSRPPRSTRHARRWTAATAPGPPSSSAPRRARCARPPLWWTPSSAGPPNSTRRRPASRRRSPRWRRTSRTRTGCCGAPRGVCPPPISRGGSAGRKRCCGTYGERWRADRTTRSTRCAGWRRRTRCWTSPWPRPVRGTTATAGPARCSTRRCSPPARPSRPP